MSTGAATNVYYQAGSSADITAVDAAGYFENLYTDETHQTHLFAQDGALTAMQTEGNKAYTLIISGAVNMTVDTALNFNKVSVGSTLPTSVTLNLGENGMITTAEELNFGSNKPAIELQVTLSDAVVTSRLEQETVYSRPLLDAEGNWGIWNAGEGDYMPGKLCNISLTLSGAEALGLRQKDGLFIKDTNTLDVGEYAILYAPTSGNDYNKLTLVIKTPEPATATLSLLALAGLCARRRRH